MYFEKTKQYCLTCLLKSHNIGKIAELVVIIILEIGMVVIYKMKSEVVQLFQCTLQNVNALNNQKNMIIIHPAQMQIFTVAPPDYERYILCIWFIRKINIIYLNGLMSINAFTYPFHEICIIIGSIIKRQARRGFLT